MREAATLAQGALMSGADQPERAATTGPIVRKLFLLLHGSYGNLFTAKFSTGELDANGKDKGIRAALMVWEAALAKYEPSVIEAAAQRLSTECPDFPPNLPQFEAICRACRPARVWKPDDTQAKLGMSDELRSERSRKIREEALAEIRKRIDRQNGAVEVSDGLPGLQELVARAVSHAGGDEAEALRRTSVRLTLVPKAPSAAQ